MTTVAVIGPGAVGCAAGAAAIHGGADLVIAARTPFDRLVVTHDNGVVDEAVDVRTTPDGLSHVDIILLTTKIYDTPAIAPWLGALVGPDTVVAVLQNGVTHIDRVQPMVGEATVLPVVVNPPAVRHSPGVVTISPPTLMTVPTGAAGDQFAELFANSFFDVRLTENWLGAAWTKLSINAASVVGVLSQRDNEVYLDDEASQLRLAIIEETLAVGRAEGARIPDDRGEKIFALLQAGGGAGHAPSIVVDRIAGRPTEWRDRNGVVVERAARHGIDVPISKLLTTVLRLGEPEGNR